MSWDSVKRMRDVTRMKIMLKGIVTPEDAELSVQNGIDGILVSNHGGRGRTMAAPRLTRYLRSSPR